MSDFVVGIPMGMAMGIAIGINLGRKLKPWEELTDKEKRTRKIVLGMGIILGGCLLLFGLRQYLTL